jgi:hypothetical protein
VIATKSELDAWVSASPIRESFPRLQSDLNAASLLSDFRRHVAEMHQLRQDTLELRHAVKATLQLLHENLRVAMQHPKDSALLTHSEHRLLADALTFDPNRKKAN